jgi:murein L,D-transpeptidase YcbB/YkuD
VTLPKHLTLKRPALAILVSGVALGAVIAWLSFDTRPPPRRLLPFAGTLAQADVAIASALRNTMSATVGSMVSGSSRTAVERFYIARGFAPLWVERGVLNARGKAALSYLQTVARMGLDPADYIDPAMQFAGGPETMARSELQFTALVLKYARDAMQGRVTPSRISADIHYARSLPDPATTLKDLANAQDIARYLDSFHPSHPAFRGLVAKLTEMQEATAASEADNAKRDVIIANLERWRWLPRDLGDDYVIVNVPDYSLLLRHQGTPRFRAKVVVGKPSLPTPLMSTAMTSLTVNPIWNVPRSIAEKEILPALTNNPALTEQLGLNIVTRADGSRHVYQLPGEKNALGRVRFNFPNKFAVYQHDTPDTYLFDQPMRALSHGCVRVEHARYYAVALLAVSRPDDRTTYDDLRAKFGEREIEIDLRAPVYIHLTYQTAFFDDNGEFVSVPDIYGYDARMIAVQNTVRPALAWPAPKPRIEQPWSTRLVRLAQRLIDRVRTIFSSKISTLIRL